MDAKYLDPKDASGKRIRKGALVRVVGMPDLSGIRSPGAQRQVRAVFRHIQGRCKKVRGFSRYGYLELFFRIRSGRNAGRHGVEIEPHLVLVQRGAGTPIRRSPKASNNRIERRVSDKVPSASMGARGAHAER